MTLTLACCGDFHANIKQTAFTEGGERVCCAGKAFVGPEPLYFSGSEFKTVRLYNTRHAENGSEHCAAGYFSFFRLLFSLFSPGFGKVSGLVFLPATAFADSRILSRINVIRLIQPRLLPEKLTSLFEICGVFEQFVFSTRAGSAQSNNLLAGTPDPNPHIDVLTLPGTVLRSCVGVARCYATGNSKACRLVSEARQIAGKIRLWAQRCLQVQKIAHKRFAGSN